MRSFYNVLQTAVIDENDHQTITESDAFGRLIRSNQYEGSYESGPNWSAAAYAESTYAYDEMDNLTAVHGPDAGGNPTVRTDISYDALGRKTSMTDPDMGAWQYRYDSVGNLTRQTDARGQAICFYYDGLNRLIGKKYVNEISPCPTDLVPWEGEWWTEIDVWHRYDKDFALGLGDNHEIGRRTRMKNEHNRTSWVYDERGRVMAEVREFDPSETEAGVWATKYTTRWTYDAADRVRTMTYPDNEVITYDYNEGGMLEKLWQSSPSQIDYVQDTTYDEAGRLDILTLGQGQIDYSYYGWTDTGPWGSDPSKSTKGGALSNIKATRDATELLDLYYFYDVVGNIEHINDWQPEKWSAQDYSYDDLDRVTTAQASSNFVGGYSQESYGYGPNGNLTSKTSIGSYTYGAQSASCPEGALNQPHAVVTAGSNTYCYDQNGAMRRRTAGGVTYTHSYDHENRLQSIVGGSFSATYSYDGDVNRVKATVNGETTHYPGRHFEKTTGSGYTKYYFAGGQLVAFERSSSYGDAYGRRYVFRDHLGSTSLILNGAGTKLWEDRYKAYGETYYTYRKDNDPSFPLQTQYRYTGQRQEPDIGLYDYRSRWYDPSLGRFLQPDTIVPEPGNPQALNRYSYVLNNALRYTNPSGHYLFENDPNDPYVWERDKPVDARILTTEPMVNWEETQEADILLPVKLIFGMAAVFVAGEVVLIDLAVPAAQVGWVKLLEALGVACADGDCGNEVKNAYETAKTGGRHSGLLKNYIGRSVQEILKAINSLNLRAQQHRSYIQDPTRKIQPEQWEQFDPRRQQGMLNYWMKEAANYQEQAEVLQGLLKELGGFH